MINYFPLFPCPPVPTLPLLPNSYSRLPPKTMSRLAGIFTPNIVPLDNRGDINADVGADANATSAVVKVGIASGGDATGAALSDSARAAGPFSGGTALAPRGFLGFNLSKIG